VLHWVNNNKSNSNKQAVRGTGGAAAISGVVISNKVDGHFP